MQEIFARWLFLAPKDPLPNTDGVFADLAFLALGSRFLIAEMLIDKTPWQTLLNRLICTYDNAFKLNIRLFGKLRPAREFGADIASERFASGIVYWRKRLSFQRFASGRV